MALAGFGGHSILQCGPLPVSQIGRDSLNLLRCSNSRRGRYWPTPDELKAMEDQRNMRREIAMQWKKHLEETVTERVEYPMMMDDDGDPNWGEDESGDGWGFRLDEFFLKPKLVKRGDGDESDSEAELFDKIDWDSEACCEWMVREITQLEWHEVIFEDQRPIMVYVYERYGPSWSESWDTLKELEKAVKTFYDKKKIGLRTAKIDKGRDVDLVAALQVESYPALLMISNSKLLHRIYGFRTEDEILQIAAHFFHGGRKPDFLQDGTETPSLVPEFKHKKEKKEKKDKEKKAE